MSESITPDVGTGATPERPWLGLRAYSLATQRYFFGRDGQAQEIYERVCSQPLTVLYGRSGLGKTSLLGAGLLPRLKVEGRAAAIVRLRFDDDAPSLLEQVRAQLLVLLGLRLGDDDEHADPPSLWELAHGQQARDAIALERPVLIFDQFEEIFTLGRRDGAHQRRQQATQLLAELSDLIENREPPALQARLREDRDFALGFDHGASILRIVLTLREDFLHQLERWKNRMPALMRNRMELTELDGPSASQAVLGPARIGTEPLLDEAVAAQIVRFVADRPADTPLSDIEAVPPLLSLLCAELNHARIEAGAPRIGADQVTEQGGNILNRFYQRCFQGMPDAVRTVVEETLVDDSGKHRESSSRESVLARMQEGSGEDCAACLDLLIERRLLTAELRGGAQRIELAHDLLVPLAAESRARARGQRKAEDERRRAEAQQKEAAERGRQRLTKRGFIVISVLFVTAVFFAWQSHKQGRELQGSVAQAAQRAFGRAQEQLLAGNTRAWYAYLSESWSYSRVPEVAQAASLGLQYMAPLPLSRQLLHEGGVLSAQFSPDGTRVVTASEDHTARLWDARSGKQLGRPLRHEGAINSAQFSPDGTRVVTASDDGTARLWDASTGEPPGQPLRHVGEVVFAQFSPDGTRVVTASVDHTARLWNALTGAELGQPLEHQGPVNSVRFSPDGTLVVTASKDKTARVWDAHTGIAVGEPMRHVADVESALFSPDGTQVVTASLDNTARLWDPRTAGAKGEPMAHDGDVRSAQFSPDGSQVVTASDDKTARLWDAHTGAALSKPMRHGADVRLAQFSPDGRRVVTVSDDNTAQLWDARTGDAMGEPLRHEDEVWSAQFDPDGTWVVTASRDKAARLWHARVGDAVGDPLRHEGEVRFAQFSPDGTRVVTASLDRTARLWDAHTGTPLGEPMPHEDVVGSAQFSPDGTQVVTASWDNTARLWDAHSGASLGTPLQHEGWVVSVQFSADGTRVVTASEDHTARVWDARTGAPLGEPMPHESGVNIARFSPDGTRVVTASDDHTARVWDARTGAPLGEPMPHESGVDFARFSADGMRVVTASWGETAHLWDARTGIALDEALPDADRYWSAQLSPDGTLMITAPHSNTARFRDVRTGATLGALPWREYDVYFAQFSPDGQQLVTASEDGTARLWDVRVGLDAEPDEYVRASQLLSGNRVADDGRLQVVDASVISQWRDDYLAGAPTNTDLDRVIRWHLADRATRTISPFSKRTVSEHIEREIEWALLHPLSAPRTPQRNDKIRGQDDHVNGVALAALVLTPLFYQSVADGLKQSQKNLDETGDIKGTDDSTQAFALFLHEIMADKARRSQKILDEAYALNPAHPLILFALSVFEDRPETKALWKRLSFPRIAGDARLAARAAEILQQDNDPENAKKAAEIALSLAPDNAKAEAVLVWANSAIAKRGH